MSALLAHSENVMIGHIGVLFYNAHAVNSSSLFFITYLGKASF